MLTGFRRLAAACFYILASTTPKGPIMRNFVLLMMMLLAGSVGAQAHYAFTVLPAMPVPEQAFLIRVELTPPSCTELPGALGATSPNGNVVSYYLDVPDFCWLPLPDATRTYSVPPLPTGVYIFRFYLCSNNTPPTAPCLTHSEQTVFVGGAPQPREIPSRSLLALALMMGFIVTFGAVALRRR